MNQHSYRQQREQIYAPLREEGIFTWDRMYGEEYALASIHLIDKSTRRQLMIAAQQLARIYAKVVAILQQADDELLMELGIPEAALKAVRLVVSLDRPTVIGRFDFAWTSSGPKMLEYNSDTPTGIVEAFYVNAEVCRFFHVPDPNEGLAKGITAAFRQVLQDYQRHGYQLKNIAFSALDWHEEDAGTTRYLLRQSGLDGHFIPLADLRVLKDRLYALQADDGELLPIDLLYRLHALEKLAEETDEAGYPTGAHVLDLIAAKRLALINPPSAFIAQTKAVQALIWSLHEEGAFFNEEEHEIIATYMLPTYFENRFLGEKAYVTKPILGREGGGVVLHDDTGEDIERDTEEFYWEQPMIYQELAELPEIEVDTLQGRYQGRLLWGTFFIGGQPSAIIARVGGRITGNMSYYLPVGIKEKE